MAHDGKSITTTTSPETGLGGSDRLIIEIDGKPVGLVITEFRGVVFFAAIPETWPLDRCHFANYQDAARAARELLSPRDSS